MLEVPQRPTEIRKAHDLATFGLGRRLFGGEVVIGIVGEEGLGRGLVEGRFGIGDTDLPLLVLESEIGDVVHLAELEPAGRRELFRDRAEIHGFAQLHGEREHGGPDLVAGLGVGVLGEGVGEQAVGARGVIHLLALVVGDGAGEPARVLGVRVCHHECRDQGHFLLGGFTSPYATRKSVHACSTGSTTSSGASLEQAANKPSAITSPATDQYPLH